MNTKILGKMKPAQYWQWRFMISEMQLKESKYLSEFRLSEMQQRDLEIARLKSQAFRNSLSTHKDNSDNAKKEYEEFKKELGEKLGFDLKDCVIDEYTYEVKKIED